MTPNRIAAVGAGLISLALGILPVIGNFDWQSTAGCIGGIVAVLGITQKWLTGWQAHEARVAALDPVAELPAPRRRPRVPKPPAK